MLRDVYGVTHRRWTAPDAFTRVLGLSETALGKSFTGSLLRPVPSGGALYPCELYMAACGDLGNWPGLERGVYHYDPAHHLLDVLAGESAGRALATAAGPVQPGTPPLTMLVTTFFWKNAFKYGEFGYRLGCLDAGGLLGQVLVAASARGLSADVRYRFPDDTLAAELGIDPQQESVYAIVSLGRLDPERVIPVPHGDIAADRPVASFPSVPPGWSIDSMDLPAQVHHASRMDEPGAREHIPVAPAGPLPPSIGSLPLTGTAVALAEGIPERRSALGRFTTEALSWKQLSGLVRSAVVGYPSDLRADGRPPAPVIRNTALFCIVVRVTGIRRGVYYADPGRGTLELVREADIREELQGTLVMNIFHLAGCGACFVPAGNYDTGFKSWGDRWYRVQNLEAGIIIQRLHLGAAALGLGCRVNCGYHTDRLNRLLELDGIPLTSLAQVMVGNQTRPGHLYDAVLEET